MKIVSSNSSLLCDHIHISLTRFLRQKWQDAKVYGNQFLFPKIIFLIFLTFYLRKKSIKKIWIVNIKKHAIFFQVSISDLKSARKNALEKIYSQTRYFQKNIQMGRQQCERKIYNHNTSNIIVKNWYLVSVFKFHIVLNACLLINIPTSN